MPSKRKTIQVLFLTLCTTFNLHLKAQVNQSNTSSTSTLPTQSNITLSNNNTNSSLSQLAHANQTQLNQTSINNANLTTTPTNNTVNNNSTTSNSSNHLNSLLNSDEAVPLDTKITVPFSILGALLIFSGAPMAFWGGRNRWSSYFLTGAYVGALVVLIPILRFGVIEQDRHPSNAIQGVFVLVCLISAIAAGAVAVIFWKGTRFLVGAAGGFVIGLFILSLKSNSLIPAIGLRWVFTLVCITIGFILATIPALSIHVTLFATAAMGAAAVVLGIDCFTTGGLKEFWIYIIGFRAMFPKITHFPFTVTMQAELGVMGGLFLMGAAVQWRLLEIIKKKIHELKQLDAERRLQEDAAAYRQSMALDADLALWEKRHGDDGDSMTVAVTPSKPYHSRKSSQFSLLPLASPSPNALQTRYEDTPGSNDRLPSIDSGLGLAGSLGIVEEDGDPNIQTEQPNVETLGVPQQTRPSQPRQFTTHRMSNQPQSQANTPSMLSINFEQSVNDRRYSRPPGAPSSWTSPLLVSKLDSKNNTPISDSNSRLTPSSPKPTQSRPLSCYPHFAQPAERSSRSRTTSEQPLRPTSEFLPYPSSHFPEGAGQVTDSKSKVDPKRHSEVPSRVIVGSYQTAAVRSSPPQKRESTIMTVEELDQRHRQAMKKLQLPATERASSSAADHKHSKEQQQRQSVNLKHQVPNSRSSVPYPTRDNGARASTYLPTGKIVHQQSHHSHHHSRTPPSPRPYDPTTGSSSPTSNNNFQKSKANGWLNY